MQLFRKTKPIDRAITFEKIYKDIYELFALADMAEGTHTGVYDVYYDETTEGFFCLAVRDGIIYKVEVFPSDSGIQLGDFYKITSQDLVPRSNKVKVHRALNGDMRWLSIASVAVLNRVGQIDSRELFDSFIDYAIRTNHFPVLNVYHLGEGSEIGQADLLVRYGYVYIASGYFYKNRFGSAFFEALQGRDDWGNSIEFFSVNPVIERFEFEGTTISVPVYKRGINTGITLVKERDAASVLTLHKASTNYEGGY